MAVKICGQQEVIDHLQGLRQAEFVKVINGMSAHSKIPLNRAIPLLMGDIKVPYIETPTYYLKDIYKYCFA